MYSITVCVNDFAATFMHCLATDLNTVLCNRTVKCGLPSVSVVSLNSHVKWSVTELMMCQLTFSSGFQIM